MKVALVTGASGGIGSATATRLVLDGYFTIGVYNGDLDGIERLSKKLNTNGEDLFYPIKADLSTEEGINKVIEYVDKNFSHVDVLVNNAGVSLFSLAQETTFSDWDKVMNVNAKAPYFLTSKLLPKMIERKFGSIIFVSSVWGDVGASMETAYSQSKASLIGLTKALAKEVAPSNIRVNCVLPGVIDTKMNAKFSNAEKTEIIGEIPLSRMGTAQEIAELIYFLATDKSAYITGQIIKADGGYTL